MTALGLGIAIIDAFDEGQRLRLDMLRSFQVSFFTSLLFGGQVVLAIILSDSLSFMLLSLLLTTIAAAVGLGCIRQSTARPAGSFAVQTPTSKRRKRSTPHGEPGRNAFANQQRPGCHASKRVCSPDAPLIQPLRRPAAPGQQPAHPTAHHRPTPGAKRDPRRYPSAIYRTQGLADGKHRKLETSWRRTLQQCRPVAAFQRSLLSLYCRPQTLPPSPNTGRIGRSHQPGFGVVPRPGPRAHAVQLAERRRGTHRPEPAESRWRKKDYR